MRRSRVSGAGDAEGGQERAGVRERILETASELFYSEGARAVGVDLVVERSGVAKTSLYRHFPTKDDLIAAFLQRQDERFWRRWDDDAQRHAADAAAELEAHLARIGSVIAGDDYRGCPQLNTAIEFPAAGHPARAVALAHKQALRERLRRITGRLGVRKPDSLADQLALVIDGAFVDGQLLDRTAAAATLATTVRALVAAAKADEAA